MCALETKHFQAQKVNNMQISIEASVQLEKNETSCDIIWFLKRDVLIE